MYYMETLINYFHWKCHICITGYPGRTGVGGDSFMENVDLVVISPSQGLEFSDHVSFV